MDCLRECEVCFKEFSPKTYSSQFCSLKCSKTGSYRREVEKSRLRAKQWYKDNLERAKKRRKEYYHKNKEKWKEESREYYRSHKKEYEVIGRKYKDKLRHGGKREDLIKENGLVCSTCGKTGNRYQIITHHITLDSKDHSEQELLCRSCHCRLHHSNEKKPLTREQIEMAISKSKNLSEACKILGVNRASLYVKRKRLGLL